MQSTSTVKVAKSPRTLLSMSFERFELILLVILGAAVLCLLIQAYHFLPVLSDNMFPEAAGIVSASRWANGLPLYEDFRRAPYLLTSFPPLWYMTIGLAAKAGVHDLDSLTLFGRILSLLSLFGVAVLALLWNRKQGFRWTTSLVAPALYLSLPILIPWAVTARPDLPGLFFSFLAIYVVARKTNTSNLLLSAGIATLAFFVRHNSVAVPLAIVLWLVWKKEWKRAVLFSTLWWAIVAAAVTVLQISTHGLFLLNLGGSKFGSMTVTYARDVILRLLTSPESGFVLMIFTLGGLGVILSLAQREDRTRLLAVYIFVSLFFSALGSAAAGAAVNHFLEPLLVLTVIAPCTLVKLRENWNSTTVWPAFAFLVVMIVLLPSLDMQRSNVAHRRPEDLRSLAVLARMHNVFTDIPYIGARSHNPQFLDSASLSYAERSAGVWSSAGLVKDLENHRYDVILVSEDLQLPYDPTARYPRYPHLGLAIRNAILANYQTCMETANTYLYVPKTHGSGLSSIGCDQVSKEMLQPL